MPLNDEAKKELDDYYLKTKKQKEESLHIKNIWLFVIANAATIALAYSGVLFLVENAAMRKIDSDQDEIKIKYQNIEWTIRSQLKEITSDFGDARSLLGKTTQKITTLQENIDDEIENSNNQLDLLNKSRAKAEEELEKVMKIQEEIENSILKEKTKLETTSENLDDLVDKVIGLSGPESAEKINLLANLNTVAEKDGWQKTLLEIKRKLLPSGSIVIWSRNVPPPSGWEICDGRPNTPNLIDKFIYGGALNQVGVEGGASTHRHQLSLKTAPVDDQNFDRSDNHAIHTSRYESLDDHTVNTAEANHLPPYAKYVFIIKL